MSRLHVDNGGGGRHLCRPHRHIASAGWERREDLSQGRESPIGSASERPLLVYPVFYMHNVRGEQVVHSIWGREPVKVPDVGAFSSPGCCWFRNRAAKGVRSAGLKGKKRESDAELMGRHFRGSGMANEKNERERQSEGPCRGRRGRDRTGRVQGGKGREGQGIKRHGDIGGARRGASPAGRPAACRPRPRGPSTGRMTSP